MSKDDVVVRVASRAIHEHLCKRDIMQYLDNDEDCEGLAHAALSASGLEALQAENARLREALEPSGYTKAAYMGEFHFIVMMPGEDEDGDEDMPVKVYVPWTTIKEIMAAVRMRALKQESSDAT